MARKYRDYGTEEAANIIILECVKYGESSGWGGSLEELEAVEKICNTLNVKYVDDFRGTWKIRK